jgi:hypothetical protein
LYRCSGGSRNRDHEPVVQLGIRTSGFKLI